MRPHVSYERELLKISRSYKASVIKYNGLTPNNVRRFIDETLELYSKKQSFENDLNFAYYVCSSVFEMIIESIVQNEINNRVAM